MMLCCAAAAWNNNARHLRAANRNRNTRSNRDNNIGFRLAIKLSSRAGVYHLCPWRERQRQSICFGMNQGRFIEYHVRTMRPVVSTCGESNRLFPAHR
jgi:hypothetical protein